MTEPVCSTRCALDGIVSTPEDVSSVIQGLAEEGISPDTFHCEERQMRLATLAACSPGQVSLFRDLQVSLADRVGEMSTFEIAENLRRLYDQAYAYDPLAQTMDVGDCQAKRELDLWIAVIDRRAFEDEGFLDRIQERMPAGPRSEDSRDIEIIMALNSPNLTAGDRGCFHRLREGLTTWEEETAEGDERLAQWLESYDGRTPLFETPYFVSLFDFYAASAAWLGRERLNEIGLENFSQERLTALGGRLGLNAEVEYLRSLSDEDLMGRLQDLVSLMGGNPAPELMRRLAGEISLGNPILSGRGGDFDSRYREMAIQNIVNHQHFTREEAELFFGRSGEGAPRMTASRLDDYRRRFEFLGKFRELYREFLTTPVQERFSPQRMARFTLWGQQILNGGRMQGAPIAIEDLDRIRREVQEGVGVETSGPIMWEEFISRDPSRPLLIRPGDLGAVSLAEGACDEPLAFAPRMLVNGRPLSDILNENVEFVAVLPPELVPVDHAAGLAYGLFGVVILNGREWQAERNPSPAYFFDVLAHEVAGHEVWARSQFDRHPERVAWLGANERYAYATGLAALNAYVNTGCAQPADWAMLSGIEATDAGRIEIANRRLGLPAGDRTPRLMADSWIGRPFQDFLFQPGYLLGSDGREIPNPLDEVKALSLEERHRIFEAGAAAAAVQLGLNAEDERAFWETIASLRSLGPDQVSTTFTASHPFLRIFNRLTEPSRMAPLEHAAFSRASWEQWETMLTSSLRQRAPRP